MTRRQKPDWLSVDFKILAYKSSGLRHRRSHDTHDISYDKSSAHSSGFSRTETPRQLFFKEKTGRQAGSLRSTHQRCSINARHTQRPTHEVGRQCLWTHCCTPTMACSCSDRYDEERVATTPTWPMFVHEVRLHP